jgi:hypothetical protein
VQSCSLDPKNFAAHADSKQIILSKGHFFRADWQHLRRAIAQQLHAHFGFPEQSIPSEPNVLNSRSPLREYLRDRLYLLLATVAFFGVLAPFFLGAIILKHVYPNPNPWLVGAICLLIVLTGVTIARTYERRIMSQRWTYERATQPTD